MNKFDLVQNPAAMPERIVALPELNYPDRLNAPRALFEAADAAGWSERIAYFCGGETWTYGRLIDETRRLAAMLSALGIAAEDRVLFRMADTPLQVAAILAAKGLGAIAVPTYTQLRAKDIAYRIEDSQAALMLVDEALLDEVAAALDDGAPLETVVVVGKDPAGRFPSLEALLSDEPPPVDWADTHADDVCLILYTSGTTGRPKAAAHSHRDILSAGDTWSRHIARTRPDDIYAGPPALPFAMGLAFLIYYPLRFGASAVLCPEKTVEAFARAFSDHRPTIFISVPTFYHRLLAHRRAGGDLPLDSFRMLVCAGEPLYPEFETAWHEETGVPLQQVIGTTEFLHAFAGFRAGIDANRRQCLGRACPGYEISVRDPETFAPMPRGSDGLMCVRGPTTMVYWSPREVQDTAVRDGWGIIQDVVRLDDDGYLYFVARHDEMIVSGGLNISPVDVERVLLTHPAVAECACTASPDDTGERAMVPKAFIVLEPGRAPDDALAAEVQDWFKANGPPFMYPRKIEFVDGLPKSLTGKIQRSALRRREFGD